MGNKNEPNNMFEVGLTPEDISTGMSIASSLLSIADSVHAHSDSPGRTFKSSERVLLAKEETIQKGHILATILRLREKDKLSEDEFKLMMLAYTTCSKF